MGKEEDILNLLRIQGKCLLHIVSKNVDLTNRSEWEKTRKLIKELELALSKTEE